MIKVEDIRVKPAPTFEDIRESMRQALLRDQAIETVANLRKAAKIEIIKK